MADTYAHLLQPGRIGRLELRNRIVMAPMGSNFAESDGHCGERIQAYYEARARGGAGLLTMGVGAIAYPAGTAEPYQVGISRDDFIPGLAGIAERVQQPPVQPFRAALPQGDGTLADDEHPHLGRSVVGSS